MKKILTASLVTAMALTSVNASTVNDRISDLETELAKLKKKVKKQNTKINEVKAHDAGDNIKWGADVRTAIDSINYEMAAPHYETGKDEYGKNDLMSLRVWLNMEYAADQKNIFKGQLAMHKAFGADFGMRGWGMDNFDWLTNEALTNGNLRVRQAYWLYLGDNAFGSDIPWTFSIGRRPSTNGFLANLRDDDPALSPLGHVINVEFDGLSSKLDLSGVTGITGMSFKVCMGQGSTNAAPRLATPVDYSEDAVDMSGDPLDAVKDIKMAGFIFEPYNDGQYIVKSTWYKAFNLPDMVDPMDPDLGMQSVGNIQGAALSVMVDGLGESDFLFGTKLFASFAWSKTSPKNDQYMLVSPLSGDAPGESHSGTSYWLGAQLPVLDGKLGLEYNHGSQYWRPFTYAEDTMAGSKLAVRGDAFEAYYTYQLTDALSTQLRYTVMNYDYTGSNGFFGGTTGGSIKIDKLKQIAYSDSPYAEQAYGMLMNTVEKAQDLRFYIRYRF
jgi:hypothetical protein